MVADGEQGVEEMEDGSSEDSSSEEGELKEEKESHIQKFLFPSDEMNGLL